MFVERILEDGPLIKEDGTCGIKSINHDKRCFTFCFQRPYIHNFFHGHLSFSNWPVFQSHFLEPAFYITVGPGSDGELGRRINNILKRGCSWTKEQESWAGWGWVIKSWEVVGVGDSRMNTTLVKRQQKQVTHSNTNPQSGWTVTHAHSHITMRKVLARPWVGVFSVLLAFTVFLPH